jgi:hypothetical protein
MIVVFAAVAPEGDRDLASNMAFVSPLAASRVANGDTNFIDSDRPIYMCRLTMKIMSPAPVLRRIHSRWFFVNCPQFSACLISLDEARREAAALACVADDPLAAGLA